MPVSPTQARDVDAPAVPSAGARRGASGSQVGAPDLSGEVLGGRYRLLRPLGHGGMATIYEAEHVEIGKRVAIKVVTPGRCEATAQRFLMEARAASQLRHEHIIDVTDYGRHTLPEGEPVAYLVMEYLEGEDLAATLEQDGPLRWTRVLAIAKQICRALIAAHDQGIVHCDIKPANCFRILRGDTADYIKVLDFGVASFACKRTGRCTPEPVVDAGDGRRKSGPRLGTPGYMAGELLSGGTYDHRVDIYALGVLMYRLLTNKMPYPAARLYAAADSVPGTSADSSGSRSLAPFPMQRAIPTLEISPAFEAVVLRALAQDPEQRHPSARALYEALVAAEQEAQRPSPLPRDPLCWGPAVPDPRPDDCAPQLGARSGSGSGALSGSLSAAVSRTEVSRPVLVAHGSGSAVTAADLGPSSSWQGWQANRSAALGERRAPGWSALTLRGALALLVTTAAVRAAWSLMS